MRALVEGQPSRTAMVVVLMRAAHTRSGRPSLIEDPWADRLVPEAMHAFEAERILTVAGFLGRWRLRLLLRSRQAIVDFGGHETLHSHQQLLIMPSNPDAGSPLRYRVTPVRSCWVVAANGAPRQKSSGYIWP